MVNKGKKESNALRFKAYKAIKEKIIYLDFKPGEKIFENELAKVTQCQQNAGKGSAPYA